MDKWNAVLKYLLKKFPLKVLKFFVQCQNVLEKNNVCKNKSTKRPVGRHNAILETLSDFFSTIVQNFLDQRLFRSKKNL